MDITEFELLEPSRVDAVKAPANGIGFLALKSIDVGEVVKTWVDGLCSATGCEVCKGRFGSLLSDHDFSYVEKAKLKAKERKALPDSDFALPDKREFPIHDISHARAALSMLHNASPEDQAKIKAAVHRRYPEIGDDAAKTTVSHAESETQTHEVSENVGSGNRDTDNEDDGEPRHVSFAHNPESDGGGDTAPDKSVPKAQALTQTEKAEVNMTGDTAPDDDDKEKTEAETQTEEVEKAVEVLRAFAARTKAEEDATKGLSEKTDGAVRHITQALSDLYPTTPVSKEIEDMNTDELTSVVTKILDDRDVAARQAKADKKAKKETKSEPETKVEDPDNDAAEDAEASKAVAGSATESKVKKSELIERLDAAEKLLAKVAGEDSGHRPLINTAGFAAVLRGPNAESAFKALEDRVANAKTPDELRTAQFQLAAAKMVANENARERDPGLRASGYGPNAVKLFDRTGSLGEDPELKAI